MTNWFKVLLPTLVGVIFLTQPAVGQGVSLQDIVKATKPLPEATIYVAKEIVTLDPAKPRVEAVAVVGNRIVATGSLKELQAAAGKQKFRIDRTFADKIIVPGFVAQHDHPFLSGLTMTTEIIAIEDWVLPSGTVKAAKSQEEYRARLKAAEAKLKDPKELLLTWGYHRVFHGPLTRADLDKISATRPIIVWQRSAHEFILNSTALKMYGIDDAFVAKMPEYARKQSNLKDGHFFEGGALAIVPKIMPVIATPERFRRGLEFVVRYYHANGITLGSEPGGIYSKALQDAQNAVLSDPNTPFRWYYIPDGKSIVTMFPNSVIAETEKTLTWGRGMTSMLPKQIKLFADGAIFALAMQVSKPYVGGVGHGEWLMPPKNFAKAFQIYWDAGYQVHVHVNGDKGLDMVLNNLEANMRRKPRYDHRTVIIHFAVSRQDQIARIKRLGAIVSGNPYYVTALSDQYRKVGLGQERADNMVRMGDVERAGISFSFHADMPMAPGQPLLLMHAGVNRLTVSGRIAGGSQRISRLAALKAVTLEAAYSLRLEKEVGSIVPGKLANFTILSDNPLTVRASTIKDIAIWGTVHEGRKLKVAQTGSKTRRRAKLGPVPNKATLAIIRQHASQYNRTSPFGIKYARPHSDICMMSRRIAGAIVAAHGGKLPGGGEISTQ